MPHCVASESHRKKCVHVVNGVHHTKPCIHSCCRVRTTKPCTGSSTSARCAMYSRLSFCSACLLPASAALSSRPVPLPPVCVVAVTPASERPEWSCGAAAGGIQPHAGAAVPQRHAAASVSPPAEPNILWRRRARRGQRALSCGLHALVLRFAPGLSSERRRSGGVEALSAGLSREVRRISSMYVPSDCEVGRAADGVDAVPARRNFHSNLKGTLAPDFSPPARDDGHAA